MEKIKKQLIELSDSGQIKCAVLYAIEKHEKLKKITLKRDYSEEELEEFLDNICDLDSDSVLIRSSTAVWLIDDSWFAVNENDALEYYCVPEIPEFL